MAVAVDPVLGGSGFDRDGPLSPKGGAHIMTSAQAAALNAAIRRMQSQQRQAVANYNAAVRRYNTAVQQLNQQLRRIGR